MTSLQLSEKAPPDWGLHPCYHCGLPEGMQKGGQPGRQPHPPPGPCPFYRRRDATSYGLMGPGLLSMLYFLASMLRSLRVAIMAEKQTVIFLLDSGAHFCLTFPSQSQVQ
jgi:hypothetical protein